MSARLVRRLRRPGLPTHVVRWLLYRKHGRLAGLGMLSKLSDELLLCVLGHLPAQSLLRAAGASRALYCFCSHEELWRALTLQVLCSCLLGLQQFLSHP